MALSYDLFTGLRKSEKPIITTVGDVARDYTRAVKGDSRAQFKMAELSSKGGVIAKTPVQAADLYKSAATNTDNPNSEAAYKLGMLYKKGDIGLPQNSKDALYWLNYAKETGYKGSVARDFADLYNRNRQTISSEARDYYEQAIVEGDLDALFRVGKSCNRKNPARSREYVYKAASKGHEDAQLWLAHSYASGTHGYRKNTARAAEWFTIAANKGNPEAQYEIGLRLIRGIGVTRDKQRGFLYLIASANQGNTSAKQAILNLLRTTHLGSAKNLASGWLFSNDAVPKTPKTPKPGGRGNKLLGFLKSKLGNAWDGVLNLIDW